MSRTALLACLLASSLYADEPIVGTWRVDPLKGAITRKPLRIELKDGMYRCLTCTPPFEVKMDGEKHPVPEPYGDGMSMKVLDDHTVEAIYFEKDRQLGSATDKISADGLHRTRDSVGYAPDGTKVTSRSSWERVGAPTPGAHALNGTWGSQKTLEVSDTGREYTYRLVPGGLAASDPTGFRYEARFDGKRYAVKGADFYDEVRIRKIDARTYEEKYWYKGKIAQTNHMVVSTDGNVLTTLWSIPGSTGMDVAERK